MANWSPSHFPFLPMHTAGLRSPASLRSEASIRCHRALANSTRCSPPPKTPLLGPPGFSLPSSACLMQSQQEPLRVMAAPQLEGGWVPASPRGQRPTERPLSCYVSENYIDVVLSHRGLGCFVRAVGLLWLTTRGCRAGGVGDIAGRETRGQGFFSERWKCAEIYRDDGCTTREDTEKHRPRFLAAPGTRTTPWPGSGHARLPRSAAGLPPEQLQKVPAREKQLDPAPPARPRCPLPPLRRERAHQETRPRALTVHADVMVREDDGPGALGGPAQRDVNGAMQRLDVLLLGRDSRQRGLSWGLVAPGAVSSGSSKTLLAWS